MPLHPEAQAFLDLRARVGAMPVEYMTVPQARLSASALTMLQGDPEPVAMVRDVRISADIGARIYTPADLPPGAPIIVYFHGGGWVIGDIDLVDRPCRSLANAARAILVSVDYRLAPEHRFPAAVDDASVALAWAADNAGALGADAGRLIVAGDSAGGNLAAVACLDARDRSGPAIAAQLLIYPATNFCFQTESYDRHAEGYMLSRASALWFWAHYLGPQDCADDPRCSPLRAPSHADLPPAFVATAEYDPLMDEGAAYADKLREAGVPLVEAHYPGMMHGFFWTLGLMPSGRALINDMVAAIERLCPAGIAT